MDLNASESEKAVTDLFLAAGARGNKYVKCLTFNQAA